MTTWWDWDGTVKCKPQAIEYPKSIQEVIDLVNRACSEGITLRVFGAGHSWSPLVKTDGILVNLDNLNIEPEVDAKSRKVIVSAGTRLRDLGPFLQQHGLALRNTGAITAQSIAGALTTGTHGTGLSYGIMGTQVSAMEVVDGRGKLCTFDMQNNPDEMAALRLSLGCLGIIVKVTIDCVEDHSVELRERPMTIAKYFGQMPRLLKEERHRTYWFPNSQKVYVNTMNTVTTPSEPGSIYTAWDRFLRVSIMGLLWKIGQYCNWLIPACNKFQESAGFVRFHKVGRVFDTITTPIPPLHQEAEVAVPVENAIPAIKAYEALVTAEEYQINVPSEIRFVKEDDVWLSPCYGRDNCYIGGYTATYRPNDPFFRAFCKCLGDLEGRPHWGKIGAPDRALAQKLYPRFKDFEAMRTRFDPDKVFANEYIRELFNL